MSDLQLASVLLDGFVAENPQGACHTAYLVQGSEEELTARKALARLLRDNGPLDWQLRLHLADLFDPPKGERRRIEIVSGGKGGLTDHLRNTQIACYLDAELNGGKSYENAVADAAAKFGLSESRIKQIWGIYRVDRTILK